MSNGVEGIIKYKMLVYFFEKGVEGWSNRW